MCPYTCVLHGCAGILSVRCEKREVGHPSLIWLAMSRQVRCSSGPAPAPICLRTPSPCLIPHHTPSCTVTPHQTFVCILYFNIPWYRGNIIINTTTSRPTLLTCLCFCPVPPRHRHQRHSQGTVATALHLHHHCIWQTVLLYLLLISHLGRCR